MIYSENFYGFNWSPDFLKEMTEMLIHGLTNLHMSLNEAIEKKEADIYIKKLMRTQFALVLVNNENLYFTSYQIKKHLLEKPASEINFQLIDSFRKICNDEIYNLTKKLDRFKKFYPTHRAGQMMYQ